MNMKALVFSFFTALILCGLPSAEAAKSGKIYTCEVNGTVVYTSRPAGDCHAPDLPAIGRYSSSRYDAPEFLPQQNEQVSSKPVKKASKVKPKNTPTAKAKTQVAPIRQTVAQVQSSPVPKPSGNHTRRSILETELGNERKALSEAQKLLAQARAAKGGLIDRQQIKNLEGSVLDRQQNIQALQRELGRM